MSDDPELCSALEIDLAAPSGLWARHLADAERCCKRAARATLAAGGVASAPAELSIVLGDDALIRALNKRWRGQDGPTNVLSFPTLETPPPGAPRLLGDVVLAFETIAAEAKAQEKPLLHHLQHLVVHGTLHLLGFDHVSDSDASGMEALETAVLAGLGVPDPYRVREGCDG
jgi:probable rRNA maturation factor